MTNLRHLAIGTYERVKGMDIPKLLDYNHAIKHLEIDVNANKNVLTNDLRVLKALSTYVNCVTGGNWNIR